MPKRNVITNKNTFNNVLKDIPTYVINLATRKDKRKKVSTHLRRREINHKFYKATLHENPKRGCLESHLTLIREAIEKNVPYVMLMEDDVKFVHSPRHLDVPPEDWHMVYFGGTIHRVIGPDGETKSVVPEHKPGSIPQFRYHRVQCWTTHCYILNLTDPAFVEALLKMDDYEEEVDKFYLQNIHPNFNAYVVDPMIAIQQDGFSDIEGREVNYDFMQTSLYGLREPEHYKDDDGNYVLKMYDIADEDLPPVTIITPTYRRKTLFEIAIRNFQNFEYPAEKLNWIILDDSPEGDDIESILPHDNRISYLRMEGGEQPLTIAQKRNIGCQRATTEFIVFMDDDDYYPPMSVLVRVKMLSMYMTVGIRCVGCTRIGVHDLVTNHSTISSDSPISFSEASMAFLRAFWEEQQFNDATIKGEHKDVMENRLDQCMTIPYEHVIYAINHRTNFTKEIRDVKPNTLKNRDTNKTMNFMETWDEETEFFFDAMRNKLLYGNKFDEDDEDDDNDSNNEEENIERVHEVLNMDDVNEDNLDDKLDSLLEGF
jgi:glycosyltransferase involved in cell wall biosynthesis